MANHNRSRRAHPSLVISPDIWHDSPMSKNQRSFQKQINSITKGLSQIEGLLSKSSCKSPEISGWSVAQQMEHTLKANILIANMAIEPSLGPTDKGGGLLSKLIFLTGRIPRGRGKTPEFLEPIESDSAALESYITQTGLLLLRLSESFESIRSDRRLFPHPVLGGLTRLEWVRFMQIHQHHHLKIIRDIINSF